VGGKSIALSDKVLDMLATGAFPSVTDVPATCYVALLHTAQTLDDGTGAVETTYTNYARQSIVSSSTGWNAPATLSASVREITNKLLLTFPTAGATGDTGINAWALCKTSGANAVTVAGEVIYWGTITGAPKTINSSDPVSVASTVLLITED
jgi:hypothetical protein